MGQIIETKARAVVIDDEGQSVAAFSAELDRQIQTAKAFPRDLPRVIDNATKLATMDQETATECFFALKRDGKVINGPSIRLAEIMVYCWTNVRAASRITDDGGKFVTAEGLFFDLENNNAVRKESRRRITTKDGAQFGDDMIAVTANAAASIALRNAVFAGIPKAVWGPVYDAAMAASISGDIKTVEQRREKAISAFASIGVNLETILKTLEKPTRADITPDDIATLQGFWNAIKQEGVDPESIFGGDGKPAPAKVTGRPPASGKGSNGGTAAPEKERPGDKVVTQGGGGDSFPGDDKQEEVAPGMPEWVPELESVLADCKNESDIADARAMFADKIAATPESVVGMIDAVIDEFRAKLGTDDGPFVYEIKDQDGDTVRPASGDQFAKYFERITNRMTAASAQKLWDSNRQNIEAAIKHPAATAFGLRAKAALDKARAGK